MVRTHQRMTADEFKATLVALGLTNRSFARLLKAIGDGPDADKVRTVQRWATGEKEVPTAIEAVLNLLGATWLQHGTTPRDVEQWFASGALRLPLLEQLQDGEPVGAGEAVVVADYRPTTGSRG